MFEKPNHYLSLLLNKKSTIILFLVFFALLIPTQSVNAIIDPFSFFDTQLEGIGELSEISIQFIEMMFLLFVVSSAFLMISAYLLQWVIVDFPIGLQNVFVQKGWTFTLSLANLSFIIIFVIIALSFILKRDTVQTKKTLTKLVLVALLINFSLVMIGGMLDIAQIFYNTILGDGTDLMRDSISGLMGGAAGTITNLMGFISALLIASAIPFFAPAAQVSTVALVFSTTFAPTIAHLIIQISLNFIIGGIYFIYFFYFICRVFVIWFLAVLSPLAFISLIMTQTEKYWREWFDHLTEWIGVGLLLLFYLVLGIKLLPTALPAYPGVAMNFPPFSFMSIGKAIVYYVSFIVYASIGLFLAARNLPKLVTSLTSTFGTIAKRVYSYAGKPIGRAYTAWMDQEEKTRKEEGKWGELSGLGKVKRLTSTIATGYPLARWALRAAGTSPGAIHTKNMEATEERLKKQYGDDFEGLAADFGQLGPMRKAAATHRLQAIKGSKALDELTPQQLEQGIKFAHQFSPDWVKDIAKHKIELIDKDLEDPSGIGNIIRQVFVSKGKDDNYVKELVDLGIEEPKAIRKAAMKAAIGKPDDIIDYSDEILKDSDFHEAILLKSNYQQYIRKAGEKGGQPVINEIRKTYDAMLEDEKFGARFFEKNNRGILYNRNAAFMSIWPPVNEINGYNVRGSLGKGKPPRMSVYVEIEKTLHENSALAGIDKIYTKIDELEQQMRNSQKQIRNSEKRGISAISSAQIKQSNEKIEEASKEIKEATGIIKQGFKNSPVLEKEWKHIKELKNQLKEELDDKPKKNKKKEKLDDKPKKNKK